MESLVDFFYLGDYNNTFKPSPIGLNTALLLNTGVYILADKWEVSGLKTLAAEKYDQFLTETTILPTHSFIASLRLMYGNLQDGDRLLKDIAMKHAARFLGSLKEVAEFRAFCRENGSIGLEVLDKIFVVSADQRALTKGCPSQVCRRRSGRDTEVYVNTSARRAASYSFYKYSICSMEFS